MATAEGEHGSDFEETMFCEPCNKEGNTVEADGFCSDCSDYLCSTCLKYHKRLAKNHTLLDNSNMPQDFCLERCLLHPNDLVKFYCPKCDDTACSECIPIKHQTECSEFKYIPSCMQSQDVYRELKEVKKSLKAVEEEVSRTEDETGQKLKQVNLDKSDISKSISLQKKYIKDKIEEQRVHIFKALDEERVEFIRKLDERQGRRREQLFEQQELINSKVDDEERHLDDQLMLYPKKMQNIALNSANIRSKLESLTTELINKERQGRKAELFLATRKVKHNMKTLQRDIDDVREENVARCFSFRPSKEDISIDAPQNVSLGSLSEESQQRALLTGSSSSTVSIQTTQQSVRTSYASVHANLSLKESVAALRKVLETDAYDKKGPTVAMHFGVELEHKRLKNVVDNIEAEFLIHDPRLQHIVTYIMYCDCSNQLILIMLLEQFAEIMWERNEKIKKIKIAAIEWRKKLLSESENIEKLYLFWHETYLIYRKTVALFVKGVLTYFDEKYILALSYLIHAHRLSEEMKKRHKNACLPEPKISAFFLRQTLLHINDTITQQFEDFTDVTGLLYSMKTHVLPCLQTVVNSGSQEDITAVKEIREKWCSFLGQEMQAQKIEQLQDFLSKLFEPPLDLHLPKMPSLKHESMQNLYAQFAKVMENAQEYGYIERALKIPNVQN